MKESIQHAKMLAELIHENEELREKLKKREQAA